MAQALVVGLPGTLCSPAVFEPVARELAGAVTVAPFSWLTEPGPWDIPAVADRVAGHIERSGRQPVLVCGHSTGGAIALQLAARHPRLVAGLVLADTGAHMRGHGDVDAILRSLKDNWGEELRAAVLDRSFRRPLDEQTRAEFLRWAAAVSPRAAYDVLASQRDLDLTGALAGISQPAIVIHGRYDRARAPEQGRELAGALPHAEFRLLDTGHTPLYEDPGAVAAAIRDVLARAR
jgi:pimeloyl-ACP methyl ester carboxylesterase